MKNSNISIGKNLPCYFTTLCGANLDFHTRFLLSKKSIKLTDTKIQNDKHCCRQHNHKKSGHSFIGHSVFFVVFNSTRWYFAKGRKATLFFHAIKLLVLYNKFFIAHVKGCFFVSNNNTGFHIQIFYS